MQNRFLDNKVVLKYCPDYYRIINEEFNEAEYNIDEVGFNAEEFIFNVSKANSTGNADEKEGQYSFDVKSYEIKKL